MRSVVWNGVACGAVAIALTSTGALAQLDDDCLWEQLDGSTGAIGQSSELDTAVPSSETADDFCLKVGHLHEITSITVRMLPTAVRNDVVLRLFKDCNGRPGAPIPGAVFESPEIIAEGFGSGGEIALTLRFDTSEREVTDEYGDTVLAPALWLEGGCYWLSPVGLGDGSGTDRWRWAVEDDRIEAHATGAIGVTRFGVGDWQPISGLNIGCRDLAFEVRGRSCCLLRDAGLPSDDVAGAVDTTRVDCEVAGLVTVPRCWDSPTLCAVIGYVWTNCDCSRSKLRLLGDDCGSPAGSEGPSVNASACTQLTGFGPDAGGIEVDGQALALYRVEWHLPELSIAGGTNTWVSVRLQGTGSLNERAFWAFEDSRCDPCVEGMSDAGAMARCVGVFNTTEWTGLGRRLALGVAVSATETNRSAALACPTDVNADGRSDVLDLLRFITAWYAGCGDGDAW